METPLDFIGQCLELTSGSCAPTIAEDTCLRCEAFAQRCIAPDRRLKHLGGELAVEIVVNLAICRGSPIIVIDHDPRWEQCRGVSMPNPLDRLVQLTQSLQAQRLGKD